MVLTSTFARWVYTFLDAYIVLLIDTLYSAFFKKKAKKVMSCKPFWVEEQGRLPPASEFP